MSAVMAMPAMSGMLNSSARPIAPPRNSARSVAMAAISLTTHMPKTTGLGKRVAAHLGQIAPGDDAELGRQRLEQHGDQIGEQHHPEQPVAVFGAGLDVGGEIARVHIGDRGDDRRPGEGEIARPAAGLAARIARAAATVRSLNDLFRAASPRMGGITRLAIKV